jgi:hypothetical protein
MQFDVLGMLARELTKTRIHAPLTRRLLQALRYLDRVPKSGAARSLIENVETLTPVLPNVFRSVSELFSDFDGATQDWIALQVRSMVQERRYFVVVPVNLAYAVRLLGQAPPEANAELLAQLYDDAPPFVQRDIMLIMGRWGVTWWLSDQLKQFSRMHPWVQRALLISSYQLADEADHWRRRNRGRFSPLDRLVDKWAEEKVKADPTWIVPL